PRAPATARLWPFSTRAPSSVSRNVGNPTEILGRRVDPARDQGARAVPERAPRPHSHAASSFVQYEITRSAPARLIAASDSSAAARSSRWPAAAAALTIAYSPETL